MSKNSNGAEDRSQPILDVALDDADDAVKHLLGANLSFVTCCPLQAKSYFLLKQQKQDKKIDRKSVKSLT